MRRGLVAVLLAWATLLPGYATGSLPGPCLGSGCGSHGVIRWVRPLSGSWVAESSIVGTVPAAGQAYVSAGPQVAAVGYRMTVDGYGIRSGRHLWTRVLAGFPPGAAIVSVRSWQRVVTAGVDYPEAGTGEIERDEVVLVGQTGQRLRSYPATAYGGAVAADYARTVVVGSRSVTSYDNASGRPLWTRTTGRVPQAWRVQGGSLLVTVAADGYLGTAPVTALRKIDLKTGAEQLIRPPGGSFDGTLSVALAGVAVFSGSAGLTAYSEETGKPLWYRAGAVAESEDLVSQTLYVTSGSGLIGLDPRTGAVVKGASIPAAAMVYGVRGGVALGLDQGSGGDAWGYGIGEGRIVWTTPSLPWPHYFVDLSGIGGSADPSSNTVLLAACSRVGAATASGTGQACLRPELVAINR
jgi:hypothetical protein